MYATVPTIWSVRVCWLVASKRAGDAEVDDLDAAGRQQHVPGLRSRWITPAPWIAVSAVATPTATPCRLRRGQRALVPDHLRPGWARRRTRPPGTAGRGRGRRRAPRRCRTAAPGGRGHLAAEPAAELLVVGELGADHLDRHRRPVGRPGQEDACPCRPRRAGRAARSRRAGQGRRGAARRSRRLPADHDQPASRCANHAYPSVHSDTVGSLSPASPGLPVPSGTCRRVPAPKGPAGVSGGARCGGHRDRAG